MDRFYDFLSIPKANEIIPGLWIGDRRSAENPKGFDVVVNATVDFPFADQSLINYRVPVRDNRRLEEILKMTYYLPKIISEIHHERQKGHKILVHCMAGSQRSATIVAAYLMKYYQMDIPQAMELIRSKRSVTFFPLVNFKMSLVLFKK
jgi:protein-tyrosine phosphatase